MILETALVYFANVNAALRHLWGLESVGGVLLCQFNPVPTCPVDGLMLNNQRPQIYSAGTPHPLMEENKSLISDLPVHSQK